MLTSHIKICLPAGQSYPFNGQMITVSGQYTTVYTSSKGCDSTVNLSLVIAHMETQQLSGCGQVNYNGIVYTSDTSLTKTLLSVLTGCDSVFLVVRIQMLALPVLNATGHKSICRGDVARLKAIAAGASIEWLGWGSGDSLLVFPTLTTSYTAIATNAAGCTDTVTVTVMVNDFDLQVLASPNPVFAGTNVKVETRGTGAYNVLGWKPSTGSPFAVSQFFVADTTFVVRVAARSAQGCIVVDSLTIVVDPLGSIYIPTAFTPNGDGKNDRFTVSGGQFKLFDLKIFNRWGQMVFQSFERTKGWDGTSAGRVQPAGTYVYILVATLKDGKTVKRNGMVTVIR
jgi:gliding motility-associated-like protein